MARKNVLFISIDDLNDWINGLGGYSGVVRTPHLDALMAEGTTFANAFSQAAICNPSRTSVLTGRTPNETGVFQNQKGWEGEVAPADTLFGVMKAAGYQSVGVGKLFHTAPSRAAAAEMFDSYAHMGQTRSGVTRDGLPAGPLDGAGPLRDEIRADFVADFLTAYEPDPDRPLLLSAGLLKPHTDWVVPQAFFDLYPIDGIAIDAIPDDDSDLSRFIRENSGITHPWGHEAIDSEAEWKGLIQAYLATISFMDAQVGKMLDALDNSAIVDNTTVMLWSDHGYHLGDKDVWHKFTLWDNAGRAPLIVRDPDVGAPGQVVNDVVELLDIYPTLLDLVGVDPPAGAALSGQSLVPYLEGGAPAGPAVAFTWMYGNVSIRTNEHRYSLYEDGSEELYAVRADPELTENLAEDPHHAAIKAALRAELTAEFGLLGYGDDARAIAGTAGADVFADDGAQAVLDGGAGDDIYFVHENATVIEAAGGGRDLIVTEASAFAIPDHVEDVELRGVAETVIGNALGNVIVGAIHHVAAHGGDDQVFGSARNEVVVLGDGRDFAEGKAGDDQIFGGRGADRAFGAVGRDLLEGGGGADSLHGGFGDDTLRGGGGEDVLRGEGNDDRLRGGGRADSLFGGFGDDFIAGNRGQDRLFGELGADTLIGGARIDFLDGGLGDDLLAGGAGRDRFVFRIDSGDDRVLDFTAGADRIVIGSGAASFADLRLEQIGDATRIAFANVTVVLENVSADGLGADDFIF